MLEETLRNSSRYAAREIITRLNGVRDDNYASKVAYEIFKTLGRIYERKYQKDVKESLDVLEPVMKILDTVFRELVSKQDIMKRSVQNSFMMAYGESTYFDFLSKLNGPDLEKTIDFLSKFDNHDGTSIMQSLLNNMEEIRMRGAFYSENQAYSDVFYSLTAAKRKIERELDWALCSLDKQIFPLLKKTEIQKIGLIASISDPSHYVTVYNQKTSGLINSLNMKFKDYTDSIQWKNAQHLSLLLKNNSKTSDALYLDSKSIPDANDLEKVLSIPKCVQSNKITPRKLAESMGIKPRMASYYLDAAEMLGIVEREGKSFKPTDLLEKLDKYSEQDRSEIIRNMIQQLPVVKSFFLYLESISKTKFTMKDVARFLEYSTDLSPSTARRRASTIAAWLNTKKIIKRQNNELLLRGDGQTTLREFFYNNNWKNESVITK